jgi:HSP20 family protein
MTTIMRYDPFGEMLSLRDAMNSLFEQSFVNPSWRSSGAQSWAAPVNVYEMEQGYKVFVLLPGIKAEDLDLTVQQSTLSFRGQFHPVVDENKQGKWLMQEFGSGSFERTLTFPKLIDADHIETKYEHGVLTLFIPISEAVRPKKISVNTTQTQVVNSDSQLHGSEQPKIPVGAGSH